MNSPLILALLACLALTVGCGEEDKKPPSTQAPVDQAFAARMSSHAETSRRLAQLAAKRAKDAGIRRLAAKMVDARKDDLNLLQGVQQRLGGHQGGKDPLKVAPQVAAEDLQVESLENAKPFDKLWMQSVLRHHQGALALIEAERKSGEDPATKALAERLAVARAGELNDITRRLQREG